MNYNYNQFDKGCTPKQNSYMTNRDNDRMPFQFYTKWIRLDSTFLNPSDLPLTVSLKFDNGILSTHSTWHIFSWNLQQQHWVNNPVAN